MVMSAWYEMVLEGREGDVRELLPGIATDGERPFWGEELDLYTGSLPDRLRELLGARTHHLLFVPGTQAGPLVRAIQGKDEIRLEHVREVLSGRFSFTAKAFSPAVSGKIKHALHGPLPPGVVLETCEEEEDVDPEAKGVELYSPVHDYTYRCHGTFSGTPPGIFEIHRTMQALDFVHQEKLELEEREVAAERLV
jgi:hypothetical protein